MTTEKTDALKLTHVALVPILNLLTGMLDLIWIEPDFPSIALPHFLDGKQNTYGLDKKLYISQNQSASKNPKQ